MRKLLPVWVALAIALAACTSPEPQPRMTPLPITPTFIVTPTATPTPVPIFLNLVWLLHQPMQAVDDATRLIQRATVRAHALNSYDALARVAERFPQVHTTANFSPVLLRQLGELASGARDVYWELSVHPAANLSEEERNYIVEHLGDAVPAGADTSAFPRFRELLDKRAQGAAAFSEQDILDAQVWHHLALFPPSRLEASPLDELVQSGGPFTEQDKLVVLEQLTLALQGILPSFRQLQDQGAVELTTSPLAYPILPLLMDPSAQQPANASAQTARPVFGHPEDGDQQMARAIQIHESVFGRKPAGFWPPGGAVTNGILPGIRAAGLTWLVAGESALAPVLGENPSALLSRDADGIPVQADALYRPYTVDSSSGAGLTVVFGDVQLSERIAADSRQSPEQAAQTLIDGVLAIRTRLTPSADREPNLITLVLDASGMSEAFFDALYEGLAATADSLLVKPVTAPEFLGQSPAPRELAGLAASTWTRPLSDWANSIEDVTAWNYLNQAREFLQGYLSGSKVTDAASVNRAYDALLQAEGADWFDIYGSDSAIEDRAYSDGLFRALLAQVYRQVGAPIPDYVKVPALQPVVAGESQSPSGFITPTLNGVADEGEWDHAGLITTGGADLRADSIISAVRFGLNEQELFFRIDTLADVSGIVSQPESPLALRLGVYFEVPGATQISRFTRVSAENEARSALGFNATHLLEWTLELDGSASSTLYEANSNLGWSSVAPASSAALGSVVELAVPIRAIGALGPSSAITFVAVANLADRIVSVVPRTGIAQMSLTSLSLPELVKPAFELTVEDPAGDDYGFGKYTYPRDAVFERGAFDLKRLRIAQENEELVVRIDLFSPISNPWDSPTGLSLQTFDIYIDQDPGKGTGARKLLEGRNAALPKDSGWEVALWIEGWNQQALAPDAGDVVTVLDSISPTVEVDPLGAVTVRVALDDLGGGDPATWGYAVAVLSQDAFPARGVRRVRDIEPAASQWRFGGAPKDTNHTRIIDLFTPKDSSMTQENGLGTYTPTQTVSVTALDADQFGVAPLLTVQ